MILRSDQKGGGKPEGLGTMGRKCIKAAGVGGEWRGVVSPVRSTLKRPQS